MMKLKNSIMCLAISSISLTSCKWMVECYPEFSGKVFSNTTKRPVEGATVQLLNRSLKVKTDRNGYFKISTSGCIDGHLLITKENYKPFKITIANSPNSNSYKVKSEVEFVNFPEPFLQNPEDSGSSGITGTWTRQNSEDYYVSSEKINYYLDTLKSVTEEINEIQKLMRDSIKRESLLSAQSDKSTFRPVFSRCISNWQSGTPSKQGIYIHALNRDSFIGRVAV